MHTKRHDEWDDAVRKLGFGLTREELIALLVWNDRNGCYTDEDRESEDYDPLTLITAREALINAAEDDFPKHGDWEHWRAAWFYARGWSWYHTGGGIFAWFREDREKDRSYYIGCDDPTSIGADIMTADGDHIRSVIVDSLDDAMSLAESLTE